MAQKKKLKLPKELTTVTTFSKYLAMILFIILPLVGFYIGLNYQANHKEEVTQPVISTAPNQPENDSLESEIPNTVVTGQARGASLNEIRYILPEGWTAKVDEDNLFISPEKDGGYFSLVVYEYNGTTGRREYYCELRKVCTRNTYFTEMTLGNIPGYSAHALDNSGGGAEYFGAKGDKFYIISSFSPSTPTANEFDKHRQEVLNSLVF